MMPDWGRRYISSVLLRAETAAQCLVFVTARLIFGSRAVAAAVGSAPALHSDESVPLAGFSIAFLSQRIAVLQAMLKDLPRFARRLIRRCLKQQAEAVGDRTPGAGKVRLADTPPDARIDRPPDMIRRRSTEIRLRPQRAEGFWRVRCFENYFDSAILRNNAS